MMAYATTAAAHIKMLARNVTMPTMMVCVTTVGMLVRVALQAREIPVKKDLLGIAPNSH